MVDDAQAQRALGAADRVAAGAATDIEALFIDQRYGGYTAADQETWKLLFDRQLAELEKRATRPFFEGVRRIGLDRETIPRLDAVNRRLAPVTGFRSRPVPGYLPARAFFGCLARRCFPTTIVIRPRNCLGYLPEPDIFHDVFGHVPLHADPAFADFLEVYGATAYRTRDPKHTLRLARLFWFTVEFGMVQEPDGLRLYGAGLLSSPEEACHALESPDVERVPFDLEQVCETPFEIDHFQTTLFVIEDFEELRAAMLRYAATVD